MERNLGESQREERELSFQSRIVAEGMWEWKVDPLEGKCCVEDTIC